MRRTIHIPGHATRHAATTVEFLTAGVLLSVVMTFLIPFVARISLVNQGIADREFALREVQNIVTELQLGSDVKELSDDAKKRLDNPQLSIQKSSETPKSLEQVTVSIQWTNRFGEPGNPVSLSYWQSQEEVE
ncbi:hypothetical protein [Thalassoglobus sp.]|uniref:hypothetical protein n=1 Tax=Thalassoglobus sp. TaxID=2795869 RepID=UPI003AA8C74E